MKTQVHLSVVWCVFIFIFFLSSGLGFVGRNLVCYLVENSLCSKVLVPDSTENTTVHLLFCSITFSMYNILQVLHTYISLFKMPKITNIYLLKNENNYSKSTLKGNVEVNPIKHSLTNKIRIKMNKMPTSKVFACKNKSTSSRMYLK